MYLILLFALSQRPIILKPIIYRLLTEIFIMPLILISTFNSDRDRLEDKVAMLTADSDEIGELMYFAITHADAAQEVSYCSAGIIST